MVKTPQIYSEQNQQNQQQITLGQNIKCFPLLRRRSLRIQRRQSSIENIIQMLQSKRNNNQVWICVDFDSFSVNCHLLENPQFKNSPCVVTQYYNQNKVISSNKIARQKIDKKEKQKSVYQSEYGNNLKVFIEDKSLQFPKTKILRNIAKQYDPFFQSCGDDEVYINVTAWVKQTKTVMNLVKEIKQKVESGTNLKVTCGVGPTAYLSKMATNQSKKNKSQISYTHVIPGDNQQIRAFLGQKKVSDLQEINEATQKLLNEFEIFFVKDIILNAKQLYQSNQLQKKKLVYYALGVDSQQIQESKTFSSKSELQEMASKQNIQKEIIRLIESCQHFLQRYGLVTNKISLNLRRKKQNLLNKIINLSILTDKKEDFQNQISKYFDEINDQMNITNISLRLLYLCSKSKEGMQIKAPKSKKIQKPKQNTDKQKLQSKRGRKKKNLPQQTNLKNTKEKDSKQHQ